MLVCNLPYACNSCASNLIRYFSIIAFSCVYSSLQYLHVPSPAIKAQPEPVNKQAGKYVLVFASGGFTVGTDTILSALRSSTRVREKLLTEKIRNLRKNHSGGQMCKRCHKSRAQKHDNKDTIIMSDVYSSMGYMRVCKSKSM